MREDESSLEPRRAKHSGKRLLRDFFRPGTGQLVVGLALFSTALLVTWTLRSQAEQPEFANARQADLVQLLDSVTGQSRRLEQELRELESTRDELATGANQADAARDDAERRLSELQIIAGIVPAEGPGVRIEIHDPEGKVSPALMLNAIEELRDAGAEVIELNDRIRLVVRSSFTADDQGRLIVDGEMLDPPFIIDAIGEPATLEAGARFRGGLVSEVESSRVGGTVLIEQPEVVQIESTVSTIDHEFAKPR